MVLIIKKKQAIPSDCPIIFYYNKTIMEHFLLSIDNSLFPVCIKNILKKGKKSIDTYDSRGSKN